MLGNGNLLLFIRELASNLRNHRNPLGTSPLDSFRNGVVLLHKPIGTIENEGNRDSFAGRLHSPGVVTAALGIQPHPPTEYIRTGRSEHLRVQSL